MYGCPGCGAELRYDIKTGRLRCKSCGGKYDVGAIKKDKEEYTFRIIVTKRQLKVTMMHMERRRQLKRKRRRFIQLPDIGRFMHRFMAM